MKCGEFEVSSISSATDVLGEDDVRLIFVECEPSNQDCFTSYFMLIDHNLCFIVSEDC